MTASPGGKGPDRPEARDAVLRLHRAGPLETAVVAALQQACFPDDPWDEASVATLAGPPGGFAVLAVAADADTEGGGTGSGEPVGFVMTRVAQEDAEILAIGVLPAARGTGIGRRLVGAAVAGARDMGATVLFLEVAEDNNAALTLYKSSGFFSVGRRPGYYKRPDGRVAALVLRRNLEGA